MCPNRSRCCFGIHHSDQGVHYSAHAYIDLFRRYDIEISMAVIGKVEECVCAVRVIRTIKEGEVD